MCLLKKVRTCLQKKAIMFSCSMNSERVEKLLKAHKMPLKKHDFVEYIQGYFFVIAELNINMTQFEW